MTVTVFIHHLCSSLMGQNEYGLYSLAVSVIAYLFVLDMGFGNAMIRFVAKNQARKDLKKEREINGMFLLLYIITGIIAFIIGMIIFLNIANIFGGSLDAAELDKDKNINANSDCDNILVVPAQHIDSYAIASERFNFLKILDIVKNLAIPLTMMPILFMGGKSISMAIVTSVFTLGYHLVTMRYCFKKLKMRITFKLRGLDKGLLKTIATYSFWIFLNIIVDNLYDNTDQIILGSICGTSAVAVYAVAAKFSSLYRIFSTSISGVFLPKDYQNSRRKDGDKKISDIFLQVSRLQMYIMTLILSGFVIFGRQFMDLWVGPAYATPIQ